MRISEGRVRRIIREELLREVTDGGSVDKRFAALLPPTFGPVGSLMGRLRAVIDHLRGRMTGSGVATGGGPLEGLERFERILRHRAWGSDRRSTDSSPDRFWDNLNASLETARLDDIASAIEDARYRARLPSPWGLESVTNLIAAQNVADELAESIFQHVRNGERLTGSVSEEILEAAEVFDETMRALDENPGDLDTVERLRDSIPKFVNFFENPDFEDYHEQVIDLLVNDPESVLQAADLVSSLMM